jgi:hypothetical protein
MSFLINGLFANAELIIVAPWRARRARTMEMTMARLDPERFPDRFELDRYARRMQQQEISRLTRMVAVGWHAWVRQLTGGAPSARRVAARGLRMH